jgi:membrane-bound metal-dependent hydrolase YbcI (DUF457 family)
MTTGHFALAAGSKAVAPRVPLWALLVASYLLDFIFIGLVAAGIESFSPMNPGQPAYGQVIIHAYYSHSLLGALVIAGIATLITLPAWGKRNALAIGAVVFSHWVLDLIVHRADLPLLPGNVGNLPMLGFGLWNYPVISGVVELALVGIGVYLYHRSCRYETESDAANGSRRRARGVVATMVTAVLLVLLAVADFLSLSIMISLLIMLLLIVLSGWLDSRVGWRNASSVSAEPMPS